MDQDDAHVAPLQLLAVAFDEPHFDTDVLDELDKIRRQPGMRIVDVLAIQKDESETVSAVQVSDLPPGEAAEYGSIIGWLVGIGFSEEQVAENLALRSAMLADSETEYGLDSDELEMVIDSIPSGGGALFVLVEHVWMLPLKQAVRDAGAVLISQDFLSTESLVGISAQALGALAKKPK